MFDLVIQLSCVVALKTNSNTFQITNTIGTFSFTLFSGLQNKHIVGLHIQVL